MGDDTIVNEKKMKAVQCRGCKLYYRPEDTTEYTDPYTGRCYGWVCNNCLAWSDRGSVDAIEDVPQPGLPTTSTQTTSVPHAEERDDVAVIAKVVTIDE